eukprot:7301227-Karenia_brevis.AAC.1
MCIRDRLQPVPQRARWRIYPGLRQQPATALGDISQCKAVQRSTRNACNEFEAFDGGKSSTTATIGKKEKRKEN